MKKLSVLALVSMSLLLNAQTEWNIICDNYIDESFSDISYVNQQNVWATGSNGHIIHSGDGGMNWEVQFNSSTAWFYGCFFLNEQTGWVVGWDEVYHTDDGGENWVAQEVPDPLGLGLNEVYFINEDTGWIAGDYQTIYATQNGGDTWIVQNSYVLPNHKCFQDIYFYDALNGMAVGDGLITEYNIAMITDDGGNTWTPITVPGDEGLSKVYRTDNGLWWIADNRCNLFKSNDNGTTWETISGMHGPFLDGMCFFNNDSAIIMKSGGRFSITSDGWDTWNDVVYYFGLSENAMDFYDYNHGIAIGWETETISTENGGYDWLKKNNEYYSIGFFDELNGWIINGHPNKGNLLHTTDGGITWNFVETPNTDEAWMIHFPTNETGFVYCSDNQIIKTSNAGNNWSILYLQDSIGGRMHFINQDTGFMCSYHGYFSKTFDGGETWSSTKINDSINFRTIFFLDSNEGWIAGNFGFYAHTTDGGQSWLTGSVEAYNPTKIYFIDNLHGFITTSQGYLYKTDDGGVTWDEMSGFEFSLIDIVFVDSQKGWIINDNNTVYLSNDGGETWNPDFIFDDYGITDMFFLDENNGWVCTDKGVIAKCSKIVSIENNEPYNNELFLYPNPVSNKLNVNTGISIKYPFICQIYSIDGKLLYSRIFRHEKEPVCFDVSNFTHGTYILKFINSEKETQMKFMKN